MITESMIPILIANHCHWCNRKFDGNYGWACIRSEPIIVVCPDHRTELEKYYEDMLLRYDDTTKDHAISCIVINDDHK